MTDKVIRDGKVAVLYAPGFGAGWSTWNSGDIAERMTYDPKLVEAVEAGNLTKAANIAETFDPDYVCVLGATDLVIAWIDVGTQFYIHEYDGSESIKTRDSDNWRTA